MSLVRLGAVHYLNARPLVYGLESRHDLFDLRFDPPSHCAVLLHDGRIDVGMIPTIEYLRGGPYHIVPGLAIVSDPIVASVAIFSRKPIEDVKTMALDTSSRTSVGLCQVLCKERFNIAPAFEPMAPDPDAMLQSADAALIIGDPALFLDHEAAGLRKIDLGEEWTALTGLPFVWAFWAGRPGALAPTHLDALSAARDEGVRQSDRIADEYCGPERSALCRRYLRENIQYTMGDREIAGLRTYYELAARHGVVEDAREPVFYR